MKFYIQLWLLGVMNGNQHSFFNFIWWLKWEKNMFQFSQMIIGIK